MGSEEGRQTSVRDRAEALGPGEERGGYAVAGPWGALAQLARRLLAGVFVVLLVGLVVISSGFQKGVITRGAVLLSLFGFTLAWRRLSARFGLRRCSLYTRGLVATGTFGRVRHAVAWSEVTELKWMSNLTLLLAFHRFEIERRVPGGWSSWSSAGSPNWWRPRGRRRERMVSAENGRRSRRSFFRGVGHTSLPWQPE